MRLSRRSALAQAGVALATAGASACRTRASTFEPPRNMVDLTHTLSPEFPFLPVEGKTFPFRSSPIATIKGDGVYANRWELTEHVGTHLDAPCHFAEGAMAIEAIPLETLFVPLAVVSIAERVATNPDTTLGAGDLMRWEKDHGEIPARAAVFLHTGWDVRTKEPGAFVNMDGAKTMRFPGFSDKAIEFLLGRRSISGIGIDTLSIDPGRDKEYAVHKELFRAGKWAVECVANLSRVPATGAFVFVAPVKVAGASGAPARIVAVW